MQLAGQEIPGVQQITQNTTKNNKCPRYNSPRNPMKTNPVTPEMMHTPNNKRQQNIHQPIGRQQTYQGCHVERRATK
jgi:hypothetical protein